MDMCHLQPSGVKNYSLIPIKGWWYHYEDGDLLVGGRTTHLKNMLVKLEIFPQTSGWKFPKYLSCHQPVYPCDSVSFFSEMVNPPFRWLSKVSCFAFLRATTVVYKNAGETNQKNS